MWEDDDDEDHNHHQESDKEDEAEIILPSDIMIVNEQRHDLQLAPLIEYLALKLNPIPYFLSNQFLIFSFNSIGYF